MRAFFLLLMAGLLGFQIAAGSQEVPPGMSAAAQLRFGVGARALGMGSAFTALATDPTGIYWNPAALGEQSPSFTGMYVEPFSSAGEIGYRVQFFGFAGSWESLGYGIGWFNSHVSDIPWTDGGGTFDYDSSVYFASLAVGEARAGVRVAVGASIKVYHDAMLEGRALGVGYDLGLLVQIGGLRLGYCSQDVGRTKYRWHGTGQEPVVYVPWVHRWGLAFALLDGALQGEIDLVYEPGQLMPLSWRFGAELSPMEWMAIRGGLRLDPFLDTFHPVFTLGLGLSPWKGLRLDYAYLVNPLPVEGISTSTHVFSLDFAF